MDPFDMDPDLDAFRQVRSQAEERRMELQAEEQVRLRELVESPAGLWLLRWLVRQGGSGRPYLPRGDNWDMYHLGRRYAGDVLLELIRRHCGDGACGTILQETKR